MKLVIQTGKSAGQEFRLTRSLLTIGAVSGNDIVVTDPTVSARHAELRWQGGGFAIADLDSTNGTLVNNQRIRAARLLRDGDKITVGQTMLAYQVEPGFVPAGVPSAAVEMSPEALPPRGRASFWAPILAGMGALALVVLIIAYSASGVPSQIAAPVLTITPVPLPTAVPPSPTPVPTDTPTPTPEPTATATPTPTVTSTPIPKVATVKGSLVDANSGMPWANRQVSLVARKDGSNVWSIRQGKLYPLDRCDSQGRFILQVDTEDPSPLQYVPPYFLYLHTGGLFAGEVIRDVNGNPIAVEVKVGQTVDLGVIRVKGE